jgi:hypothetical protein
MTSWNSTFKNPGKPMRRTSIKRKPVVKQLIELGTSKLRRTKKPESVFRYEAYLAAVRQLECMACSIQHLTEAAHSNQLRFGKGRSQKASDATAMALCKTMIGRVGCHANHDQGGILSKREWWDFEYRMITKTVFELLKRGLLVADDGLLGTLPAICESCEDMALALVLDIETGKIRVAK